MLNTTFTTSLIPKEEAESILPFIKLINPEIDLDILQSRLKDIWNSGYECMGIYSEKNLIGICGIWILHKFYAGKHLEADNVVVDPNYRNLGVGSVLMDSVYAYGISQNCISSELNCYLQNTAAQEFWIDEGYSIIGLHMKKTLRE